MKGNQMNRPIAIIFRISTGCRQYVFYSIDEIKSWVSRKPYSQELLTVLPIINNEFQAKKIIDACDVVSYIEKLKSPTVGAG